MKNELTKTELVELENCERTITKTKGAFLECGVALSKIRESKLYRELFKTFEDYCQTRWGWGRVYAHRLIQASEMKMLPIGNKIKNEAQARALASVPEERRQEVFEKASKSGSVTASSISKAAKETKQIDLDKEGWPIPEGILEDWKRAEEVQGLLRKVSEVRVALKAALEDNDSLFVEVTNSTVADLDNAYTSLKCVLPYAVCPTCSGHQKSKCTLCKGRGFMSQFRWSTCVPSEIKEMRKKAKK